MNHEIEHYYGPQVHICSSPVLQGMLAELCSPMTFQPRIDELVKTLYRQLLFQVLEKEFETEAIREPTRMTEYHPECLLETYRVQSSQKAICVNIARAGTLPSMLCYSALHDFLPHDQIRQDHLLASRVTDADNRVTGSQMLSSKIGGGKEQAIGLIPDPMGATGSTLEMVLDHYRDQVQGKWQKVIALHLIVTPEYLRRMRKTQPELIIYALRLDRGLSPQAILKSPPGLHWDQEKGLNENDYIVPGGGGFGEIMNNSFI